MTEQSSWSWCRLILLLTIGSVTGCGGCRPDDENLSREELERRAQERSEALEISNLVSLPTRSDAQLLMAKPGHWHETRQDYKSNREDLQVVAVGNVARGTELSQIPGTNIVNQFTRRTSLPKGQTKTVDLTFFVPFSGRTADPDLLNSINLNFRSELLSVPLMTPLLQTPTVMPANELKEHEFQLAVLSPEALSYEYLTVLDTVFWRGDEFLMEERTRSYHVILAKPIEGSYSLPSSMLAMTAIAVIVWDDVSPDDLSVGQREALIDWVHWGGQLIISGPSSWSRLQSSFLSPYLPAESARAVEFTTEDFATMSETWAVPDLSPKAEPEPLEIVGAPVAGLEFQLNERGNWLPGSGRMAVERQVGRGRIVLTSFPAREPRVNRWKYFSNFFSTGLLRRHPRLFRRQPQDLMVAQYWSQPFFSAEQDARMHSHMRILSRDLPLYQSDVSVVESTPASNVTLEPSRADSTQALNTPAATHGLTSEAMHWGGRGAAWNDYSGLAYQIREALKSAAGIELPTRKTILYLLAGYLICLVPVNWMIFRAIGRLEFAWVVAPILAMVGVAVVTKVARLDIGFARRTSEIAVLELQGDHPRGHLTQYLALYSSLSTNYAIEFPENDSVALPFGDVTRENRRATAETRTVRTRYGQAEGVVLEPLTVYSNSTEMIHAEQLVRLDGGLRLGRRSESVSSQPAIKNETGLDLKAALIIRRTEDDRLEVAWVGDLETGQAADLDFRAATDERLWQNWRNDPITQPNTPEEEIGAGSDNNAVWIGGVLKVIVQKTPLMPGQTRLFAYTNERPSDLAVRPAEDQYDGRCVVVAHLTPMQLGDVQPDVNIMSRVSVVMSESEIPQEAQAETTEAELP